MINLLILKGGNSLEREISLKSFENVFNHIDKAKYNISVLDLKEIDAFELIKKIESFKPDVALNLMHGGDGENGNIQGLLSMLNIKYVGSKALSSGICIDKNLTKKILKANNIPVLEHIFIKKNENFKDYEKDVEKLGYPVIIKPNCGGGSIGINVCYTTAEVNLSIKNINDDVLIEKFIIGKEVICSVLQNKDELLVLPVLDINPSDTFFDYASKYNKNTNIEFSKLPSFLQTMIQEIAKKSFNLLKCEGYANVDFIIKEEEIYVLEINTIPGFTEKSLFPKALSLTETSISDFFDALIQNIVT